MRSTKSAWLVVLILVLVAVPSMVQGAPRQMLVGLLKPGLSLSIDKGCGAVYQHGELLNITVRPFIESKSEGLVKLLLPIWQLTELARSSSIGYARPPYRPQPSVP